MEIDILVNNAGFGGHGKFHERDLARDRAMMQVNVVSVVDLTHLYLQGMVSRNSGKILHIASTAAFMPGPLQAVYFASKAFVISFSQAIPSFEPRSNGRDDPPPFVEDLTSIRLAELMEGVLGGFGDPAVARAQPFDLLGVRPASRGVVGGH